MKWEGEKGGGGKRERDNTQLAHAVMKVEKSRPWKANSIFSVWVWVESREDQCPSSRTVRQRQRVLSYSAFHSTQAFRGLAKSHSHLGGQPALLSLQIQMLISSRKSDTLRIMFNQISSHPMGQSSWHTKLTVLYTFSDFLLPSLLFTAWHHPCGQLDITGHRASSLQSGRPALYRLFDLDPLWENHWIAELQFPCLSMEIRASQGPLPGLGLWRV